MERSNVAVRSNKLFTLSSIKQATRALLGKGNRDKYSEAEAALGKAYWEAVYQCMPDWQMAIKKEVSPTQLRLEYIHAHGVGLHALGLLGKHLILACPDTWENKLQALRNIDWSKTNPEWLRRTMSHGKLSKSTISIQLTCNALKKALQLPLTPEEVALERQVLPQ
jgi:DNA sulfur modification protein DndB